jgi:radical SAM protein with 4Fe4S-binding SPASM domain
MSIIVTDFCKYGDINNFIAMNHHDKEGFRKYRKRWNRNKGNLLFLLLETVPSCNLKCPMCAHSVGYDLCEAMDNDLFDKVLGDIKEVDIPAVCMNQANEPLLDKGIFERTKKIARLNSVLDIHMNTNAALLDRENSLKILESGLTRLLIGFDGFSKEIYEKMRPGADYDKVMANIMDFLELKKKMKKRLPVVRISFVKTSVNEHETEKWFEFWKEKVDYISVQEYLTQILGESKNYLRAKTSKRKEMEIPEITCHQPFERAIIRGNGDVLPCCAPFMIKTPIGNVKQGHLKDIWNAEGLKEIQAHFDEKRWNEHPVCSKCLKITYGLEREEG